ncbi:MAG: VPLPA-CTERM sorting domain-containing protein [Paracoccaceae bacterium]
MKKLTAALAVTIAVLGAPAAAKTVSNLSGIIDEGPRVSLPGPADFKLGDFGENAARTVLSFADDATIYGRVYHTSKRRYTDRFTVDASDYSFDLILTSRSGTRDYDLDYIVNGMSGSLDANMTEMRWNGLSGDVAISLFGPNARGNSQWSVEIANVSPVPLPASALFLVAGLAGLGIAKRRKS